MIQTLADALAAQGYDTLTPVQEAVTDPELGQSDLLVSAQTGSGKTVGFGLAIASTLLGEKDHFDRPGAPLGLIIAPTRELALQVKREISWLYAKAGVKMASCVGGMDVRDERRALERGAHFIVATPGRLRDHIQRGAVDMSALRAVVLDEADEMLDLGFREDLEFILGEAPEDRRTLLFSATVPPAIAQLAKGYQRDAVRVQTTSGTSQHADIDYRALAVAPRDEEHAIINVLRYYDSSNAIVFANTRAMVNRLTTRLSNRGFSVVALSGELTQSERSNALQAMRDGRARVCVATDVAARGIDLPNLELVVHAELPTGSDTLLHRSGRTGRAGRKGTSVLIVPVKTRKKAERLLKWAKLNAEWGVPPSADDVRARDQERLLADPAWTDPVTDGERDLVDTLKERFTPEQLATAYTRLYHARQAPPEDLSAPGDVKPRERKEFGPSVWFSVSVGRKDNAEPRWILPLLCRQGDLTKDDIGAIRIAQTESFVEVKKSSVPGLLEAVGPDMSLEDGATLTKLDTAPDVSKFSRPGSKPAPGGKPYKPRKDREWSAPKADRSSESGGNWSPDANADGSGEDWQRPPRKPRADSSKRDSKPRHKPGEKKGSGPAGKPSAKPGSKPWDKPAGAGKRPYGKPADGPKKGAPGGKPSKPKTDRKKQDGDAKGKPDFASDPSRSFRTKAGRGGGAVPKRSKPKKS